LHSNGVLKPALETALAEVRRIGALRTIPIAAPLPARGTPLSPPPVYVSTGLTFVNNFTHGQRRGDANGVLGVYGGGKTTLGLQLAVESARLAHTEGNRELSVFLSYEEPESKVQPRVWANACNIRKSKVEQLMQTGNWNQLTTQANLDHYELEVGRRDGNVLSESQRWDETTPYCVTEPRKLFLLDPELQSV
jgi:hypothetical protein